MSFTFAPLVGVEYFRAFFGRERCVLCFCALKKIASGHPFRVAFGCPNSLGLSVVGGLGSRSSYGIVRSRSKIAIFLGGDGGQIIVDK